jgi:hypothetical protein
LKLRGTVLFVMIQLLEQDNEEISSIESLPGLFPMSNSLNLKRDFTTSIVSLLSELSNASTASRRSARISTYNCVFQLLSINPCNYPEKKPTTSGNPSSYAIATKTSSAA